MRLVIPALAHEMLVAHAEAASPSCVCGLLLGGRKAGELRVTRALPCPNVAPHEERECRFEIHPGVVVNVSRSLRGAGEWIVGFFHSRPGDGTSPGAPDWTELELWPEMVWMAFDSSAGTGSTPRAWWHDGGRSSVRELEVSIASRRERPRSLCPE